MEWQWRLSVISIYAFPLSTCFPKTVMPKKKRFDLGWVTHISQSLSGVINVSEDELIWDVPLTKIARHYVQLCKSKGMKIVEPEDKWQMEESMRILEQFEI
jgi:hypothetical protein